MVLSEYSKAVSIDALVFVKMVGVDAAARKAAMQAQQQQLDAKEAAMWLHTLSTDELVARIITVNKQNRSLRQQQQQGLCIMAKSRAEVFSQAAAISKLRAANTSMQEQLGTAAAQADSNTARAQELAVLLQEAQQAGVHTMQLLETEKDAHSTTQARLDSAQQQMAALQVDAANFAATMSKQMRKAQQLQASLAASGKVVQNLQEQKAAGARIYAASRAEMFSHAAAISMLQLAKTSLQEQLSTARTEADSTAVRTQELAVLLQEAQQAGAHTMQLLDTEKDAHSTTQARFNSAQQLMAALEADATNFAATISAQMRSAQQLQASLAASGKVIQTLREQKAAGARIYAGSRAEVFSHAAAISKLQLANNSVQEQLSTARAQADSSTARAQELAGLLHEAQQAGAHTMQLLETEKNAHSTTQAAVNSLLQQLSNSQDVPAKSTKMVVKIPAFAKVPAAAAPCLLGRRSSSSSTGGDTGSDVLHLDTAGSIHLGRDWGSGNFGPRASSEGGQLQLQGSAGGFEGGFDSAAGSSCLSRVVSMIEKPSSWELLQDDVFFECSEVFEFA
jgi:hypothetical protein